MTGNSDKLKTVGEDVGTMATQYKNSLDELQTLIETTLPSVWGGQDYDSFKTQWLSSKASIQELQQEIKSFSTRLLNTADEMDIMINRCK